MINASNSAGSSYFTPPQRLQNAEDTTANTVASTNKVGRSESISEEGKALSQSDHVYRMETGNGGRYVDLESFFEPKPGLQRLDDLGQILIPSIDNVNALQDHLSIVFPEFLKEHGIPAAPESVRYGRDGDMILPTDYPYADKLKSALESSPAMENELRTLNALSSHVAALQQLEPFHYEMSQASNQAEMDAIVERYQHLLGDNRRYPEVALSFDALGKVNVTSDGSTLAEDLSTS